jgi:hypothetical protein
MLRLSVGSMSELTLKPKWKRAIWLIIKAYSVLCTFIVSLYLIAGVWSTFTARPFDSDKFYFKSDYDSYIAKEYPKKGPYFESLATMLGSMAKRVPQFRRATWFSIWESRTTLSGQRTRVCMFTRITPI